MVSVFLILGIESMDVCVAYMPEYGLYLYFTFVMDLSNILGENFNLNKVIMVVKTKIKYFALECHGFVKLWDEKE